MNKRRSCGGDLFSVWPLLPILKRKVSGVMSVRLCASLMSMGGRRLFATDHLYPSPPGASHHFHHTSHSIRVKVAHTRTTSALPLLRLLLNATRPPPNLHPQPAQFSPTLPHLCSPAPALSFPCPSQDSVWQCVMNGTTLLLSSVGLV